MFYDEGAVVVASTYTKVGGLYDFGFRHDPDTRWSRWPTTAWAATPTNLPRASNMLCRTSRSTRPTAC
jgi:benzoyl-CoA reductase subunit B